MLVHTIVLTNLALSLSPRPEAPPALDARIDAPVSLAALPAAAPRQESAFGPTGGEQLFGIYGDLASVSADYPGGSASASVFGGALSFGYFLTDANEIGALLLATIISPDSGDDIKAWSLTPYYNYNFRQDPRTWYYVGAHTGFAYLDAGGDSDGALALGAHCGMRHWISPRTAFFVEPRATVAFALLGDVTTTEVLFGYTIAL